MRHKAHCDTDSLAQALAHAHASSQILALTKPNPPDSEAASRSASNRTPNTPLRTVPNAFFREQWRIVSIRIGQSHGSRTVTRAELVFTPRGSLRCPAVLLTRYQPVLTITEGVRAIQARAAEIKRPLPWSSEGSYPASQSLRSCHHHSLCRSRHCRVWSRRGPARRQGRRAQQ